MKIAERTATWWRERRVLLRASRAAWRLEQAERERSWTLASAPAEGVSIRALAAAVRLSSSRVHQIVAAADLDVLDAQLGELRAADWPPPEDPDGDGDAELDGRELIADRLVDEVGWLRQCSGWLTRPHAGEFPPAVNLRPGGDHPERALVVVDLPRVVAILDRIARPSGTAAGNATHPSRLHREPVPYRRPPAGVTHSGAEAAPVLFPCGSSVRQRAGHSGGGYAASVTRSCAWQGQPGPPAARRPGSQSVEDSRFELAGFVQHAFQVCRVRVHRGSSPSATCGGTAESARVYPGGH